MNGAVSSDALVAFGWDDRWAALAAEHARGEPGRVGRVDRGAVVVITADGTEQCPLGPELRALDAVALPAAGDWVIVERIDDERVVSAVLARRSAFVRGDPMDGTARGAQVVAANVDTVFVVHPLVDDPNLRRIERELVLAWESGAAPVVVLTKADLCDDPEAARREVEAIAPGVETVVTSAVTGAGYDVLLSYGAGHRTVALIGPSGAGKSTLVNRLVGTEVQETQEVRDIDQRGRHTTTARELVPLPGGGVLVDTPGLRAVALWDADEGLGKAFADVEALARSCRFRDCAHGPEPGCAVRAAVADGNLDAARLEHYLRLDRELDALAAREDERLRAERKGRDKALSRAIRKLPKRD